MISTASALTFVVPVPADGEFGHGCVTGRLKQWPNMFSLPPSLMCSLRCGERRVNLHREDDQRGLVKLVKWHPARAMLRGVLRGVLRGDLECKLSLKMILEDILTVEHWRWRAVPVKQRVIGGATTALTAACRRKRLYPSSCRRLAFENY